MIGAKRKLRVRILYLTRKYPPSVGGMQKHHFDLVSELRKSADVTLIALARSQAHLPWFLPYAFLKSLWVACDVIHAGDGVMAGLGWLLSRVKRRPYTVTVFGLDITYRSSLYQGFFVPAIRRADRVICISENTKRLCIEHGVDSGKCVVIPCGIPVDSGDASSTSRGREDVVRTYGIDPGDLILLSVGRLVRRKGIAWFLRRVHPSLRRTTVIVAGDGPERRALRRWGTSGGNVRILGRVDEHVLRSLYAGCDAFIMPNIHVAGDAEGLGIVLLEAGCHGLYSFASAVDGIPEVIKEGCNGTLLASGDSDQWIAALSAYEMDHDRLRPMGMTARDHVRRTFSEEAAARRYLEIWRAMIP
jgi:phosphatidylinositol alpha-1,6-mannosyltransferase